jgi:hypothetical protein
MKTLMTTAVMVLLLTACTSTRITHSWSAGDKPIQKFNKILVLGLNNEADVRIRENMEKHLVGDLRDMGITAVSAVQEYGPKAFDKLDEEAALSKLKNSGFDAVITIVLLDKSKERRYVPGHVMYTPYAVYHYRFWGYYRTMYARVYTPGYYTYDTRYFWESNLYHLGTGDLLYSAQSESFEPSSTESLAHKYGKMIVQDMVKKGVLMKDDAVAAK